jgi:Fe-Mn family superoxide dismutase
LAHVVSPIRSKANRGDVAAAKHGCVWHDSVQAPAGNLGDVNMSYQIAPVFCRPWTLLGIDRKQIESHYEHNYGGAFTRLNAISEELAALDPATASPHVIRRLKQDEAAALNSLVLHEIYFASLGGDGRAVGEVMANALARDFGSVDRWRSEFIALAKALDAGAGWVLLTWLPRAGRLINQSVCEGSQAIAGGITVLALDMHEHAYHLEFGANSISYVATFMRNIDWSAVEGRYEDAVEVKPPRPLEQKQFADLPSITVDEVKAMLDSGAAVQIIGVRPRHTSSRSPDMMEAAVWRDPDRVDEWMGELSKTEPVVAFCVYGFHVGCQAVRSLRKAGFDARYMAGGHFAWKAIKGPVKLFEPTTPS